MEKTRTTSSNNNKINFVYNVTLYKIKNKYTFRIFFIQILESVLKAHVLRYLLAPKIRYVFETQFVVNVRNPWLKKSINNVKKQNIVFVFITITTIRT